MHEKFYVKKLKELLIKSIEKYKNQKIALAFSGGLDSCIIAKLMIDLKIPFTAYVIGIENCKDFQSAEKAAKELNIKLKKITLDEKEIEQGLVIQTKILKKLYEENKEEIKKINQNYKEKLNPVSVSSNFPLFFVEKYAKEKSLISGLGADTILGGFAKYLKLSKKNSEKEIKKETSALLKFDYKEDLATAEYHNKKIIMPFLDKKVANFCLKLPYELKIKKQTRKYILIQLAKYINLSNETAYREKKSAQYGTGIMKTMKKLAKKKNITLNEYIRFIS
ncbi:hypothetical protein GF386_05820 [Candidatus Pacearchaeota archaeon]|nr:hypothetical protein [Candidatus Pacearchaeota archaeon]MBD3283611.1 hypothetical protein [Candidatus Pacearchaeota archaeon]